MISCISLQPPLEKIRSGVIQLPGSKSYTNRALIIASLAKGKSILTGVSLSDDSRVLMDSLKKLGVTLKQAGGILTVMGTGGKFLPYRGEIDVHGAGTALRFLTALCSLVPNTDITLRGNERLHARPIKDLVDTLRSLGAGIEYLGKEGCPPIRIQGTKIVTKQEVTIPGQTSSQFISALLLVAPLLPKGLKLNISGEQTSKSYIDMTVASMQSFGVTVSNNQYREYIIPPKQNYLPQEYQIEGDLSGASYFWGMAAVAGRKVKVTNLNLQSAQGDLQFPKLLQQMGCDVTTGETNGSGWIEVGRTGPLKSIAADMSSMPDTAQTLAVVASCAKGKSLLTGLSTLKNKETDRLSALQKELDKTGIKTEIGNDYVMIQGATPHGARIASYGDHRMAMAFAILGSTVPNITIESPEVVNKSFPNFWDKIRSLGIKTIPV